MDYDFFGDVHGQGTRLETLLNTLGYRHEAGAWRHPTRKAAFCGDLVDRGPEQLRTLSIVRDMVENADAICLMGNHEHNAIGWHTERPDLPGQYFRSRSETHRKQHLAFLREVEGSPAVHEQWVRWMEQLPVFLELGPIRFTHACFDERWLPVLQSATDGTGRFTPQGLKDSLTKGNTVYDAVDAFIRGIEIQLPPGHSFIDPLGKQRDRVRIGWWSESRRFEDLALPFPGMAQPQFPAQTVSETDLPVISKDHLHFFGHYWAAGEARPLSATLACLDYSGNESKPLTAYRYGGEPTLLKENFVQV